MKKGLLIVIAVFSAVMFSIALLPSASAQDAAPVRDTFVTDPNAKKDNSKVIDMPLYIGVEQSFKLPYLPENADIGGGNWRKVTKVSVSKENATLLFTPTTEGDATLIIYNRPGGEKMYEFSIVVRKSNLTKVAREIRALLSTIDGISIKIINNKVVVDGQVLLPRDLNRIHSVVKQYEGQASQIVTLSPLAQRKIAQLIENDIRNPEITVRALNDRFILEGVANDQKEKDRAEIIAKMYVPDNVSEEAFKDGLVQKFRRDAVVINLIEVRASPPPEPGKMIQLVVHFVELNKSYQKGFRFQWMPTLQDGGKVTFGDSSDGSTGTGVVSAITGTVSNLLPKLNWAKSHGHARVLQSSTLIVQDRQEGNLRNVTRIPYIGGQNNVGAISTSFADVGLTTKITPQMVNTRSDNVQLNMDFSVKNLVGQSQTGPIIAENAIQTQVIVRSGQSAAVGGLITNSTGTDYNRLPASQGDPLISLFASKQFQRNQSQFVVFITPIIKSSASAGSEKIKKKFRLRD